HVDVADSPALQRVPQLIEQSLGGLRGEPVADGAEIGTAPRRLVGEPLHGNGRPQELGVPAMATAQSEEVQRARDVDAGAQSATEDRALPIRHNPWWPPA